MKTALTIVKNLFRFYWHIILAGVVVIWALLTLAGSLGSWKAVFLDNGQVYFGHYSHIPFTRFATLRNVHFLRGGSSTESAIIVPLSSEPHGPKDKMKINVDHLVAVHVLRSDADLVKTIESTEDSR